MRIFGKRQPETVGITRPVDTEPPAVRLFHIDMDLQKLAAQQPRTDAVWMAIDHLLVKRFELTGRREGGAR